MRRTGKLRDKNLEQTINDILKSKSSSRIYLYLLKKNGAKTDQIIKGTQLHPSTVRETLSKMYEQKLIIRKKLKNDSIGKNPFIYYPISPIKLLKRHTNEMEDKLNRLAKLTLTKEEAKNYRPIRIKFYEGADKA